MTPGGTLKRALKALSQIWMPALPRDLLYLLVFETPERERGSLVIGIGMYSNNWCGGGVGACRGRRGMQCY